MEKLTLVKNPEKGSLNNLGVKLTGRMTNLDSIKAADPFQKLFPIRESVLRAIADDIKKNGYDGSQPIHVNPHLHDNEAAGKRIQSAAVIAYASAGDFARFNPHLHAIFLEGGFDREGQFVHVPSLDLAKLSHYFRSTMIAFFLKRTLINERLGRNMLEWRHSNSD